MNEDELEQWWKDLIWSICKYSAMMFVAAIYYTGVVLLSGIVIFPIAFILLIIFHLIFGSPWPWNMPWNF